MPQYKKVFDVGTYAGVSGYTRVGIPTLRTPGSGGKQVAKSLRFRSANSAYLSRTPSAGNQTTWTWSAWVKRGSLGSSQFLLSANRAAASEGTGITFTSSDTLQHYAWDGSAFVYNYITTQVFRDPSAWYHLVVVLDTSNGTSTDRVQLYINGVRVATSAFGTATAPSSGASGYVNAAQIHAIGRSQYNTTFYFDGYLAEVNFIDGQALTPSSFGEYNSDNIWVPKAYSGSYSGTNSFYLDFNDTSSVAALGYDAAGSNDWTVNGISLTAGTTYDSMYDTPTDYDNSVYGAGNYPKLNPLTFNSANIVDGGLAYLGANNTSTRATFAVPSSGKWYWELTPVDSSPNYVGFGLMGTSTTGSNDFGSAAAGVWGLYPTTNMYLSINGSAVNTTISTPALGVVFAAAYDADTGNFWIGYASSGSGSPTWFNSTGGTTGNPATGANPVATIAAQTLFPAISGNNTTANKGAINFGQRPFALTVPTGFKALNTKNITRPTDANMWFYGDTPDLMWIKNRSATADHSLTDTVRGVGLSLASSSTSGDLGDQDVAEMNKFGMTLIGASSRTTAASNSFVYWAWKGGGAAVTNTSGSITSTVSANTSAGFSVVTYTGTGANATVGHGLGPATPSMVIVKSRSQTGSWWLTGHQSIGWSNYLVLQSTGASAADTSIWGSAPTDTVINIGVNGGVNNNGSTFVAYCFAPVAGYSAFGSYTGNGSTDGPFVYTGFRPRWIMIKSSTTTTSWLVYDTSRNTYNVTDLNLRPNTSDAESSQTANYLDVLSNGFKLRGDSSGSINAAQTYIYAAFAENPFKIARAR